MFLADYHTHTLVSPDSQASIYDMAAAASAAGLRELCVTDHCDLLSLEGERQLTFDWEPSLAQFDEAEFFADPNLVLRLGLELGSAHVCPEAARNILDRPGLDFVIGSLHNRSEAAGGGDYYCVEYSTPQVCRDILDDYFTNMEALVRLPDCYDVLGHIIYPLRYMVRDGQSVSLEHCYGRLRAIFRAAVESGRGIEFNTWCGRTVEEWRPVLALYREAGGEIVTTGSDAHAPENVGKGLADACGLLRDMGFRYLTTYKSRKPAFVKL